MIKVDKTTEVEEMTEEQFYADCARRRSEYAAELSRKFPAVVDFSGWKGDISCLEFIAMQQWCDEHTPGWGDDLRFEPVFGFKSEEDAFFFLLTWR